MFVDVVYVFIMQDPFVKCYVFVDVASKDVAFDIV